MVDPKHPFAYITADTVQQPAIVIEWQNIKDSNGYPTWHARCLYWLDAKPAVTLVPQMRVAKA